MAKIQLLLILSLIATRTFSQKNIDSTAIKKIEELSFLQGNWQGTGWVLMGQNSKKVFVHNEKVEIKAGGQALTFDGTSFLIDTLTNSEIPLNVSFLMVSAQPRSKSFHLNIFTSQYGNHNCKLELLPNKTLEWQITTDLGNRIRFKIIVDNNGQWTETAEFTQNGKRWTTFASITLIREK